MTEKELRDFVLLTIYNNQDKLNIENKPFCEREGITFSSDEQCNRVFKSLKESGYLIAVFYESGDCYLRGITSKGVDYIENPPKTHLQQSIVVNGGDRVVVNLGNINDGVTQNVSINDAEVLKFFSLALDQLQKTNSFDDEEKEEITDALTDYKESIEKNISPNRSIIRNISKYASRLCEVGEAFAPIIQFAIEHKHLVGL